MTIRAILRCIEQCQDAEAMKELSELAGFYNQLYTVLITSRPALEHERKWSGMIDRLTEIGNELIAWLGRR